MINQRIQQILISKLLLPFLIIGTLYIFSLYWPYKFWQQQHHPKYFIDNNDTCERATSPVRILTPVKRLSASPDRSISEARCSSSRLSAAFSPTNNYQSSSRRSHRVATSRSISVDNDSKSIRGKTPLI